MKMTAVMMRAQHLLDERWAGLRDAFGSGEISAGFIQRLEDLDLEDVEALRRALAEMCGCQIRTVVYLAKIASADACMRHMHVLIEDCG